MYRAIVSAAFLVASALPTVASAQGLKLSPVFAYYKVPPGESAKQTYLLQNQGAVSVNLTVSLIDAWHDAEGKRIFPELGGSPQGLGKWLVLPAKTRFHIPGKGEAHFEGMVTVPPNTPPGTYLGGYALTFGSGGDSDQEEGPTETISAGARITTKIVMMVHVDVRELGSPAPTPDVEIIGQSIESPQGVRPLLVRLHLVNHGRFEIKPAGTLAILDNAGKVVGKADFTPVSLWPLQQLWFEAQYNQPLSPGKYAGFAAFALQDPTGLGEAYSAPPLQRRILFEVGTAALKPPSRPVAVPKKPEVTSKTHGT